MKRDDATMTSKVLIWYSGITVTIGIIAGGYLIVFNFKDVKMLLGGALIILGAGLLAAMVRMFGNIGKMLFEFTGFQYVQIVELKNQIKTLDTSLAQRHNDLKLYLQPLKEDCLQIKDNTTLLKNQIKTLDASLSRMHKDLTLYLQPLKDDCAQIKDDTSGILGIKDNTMEIKDSVAQIDCDSKDINKNIDQLKTFFEQIEKHLDLNE